MTLAISDQCGDAVGLHPFAQVFIQHTILVKGFFEPKDLAICGFVQYAFG